jgi:hypothetical protein
MKFQIVGADRDKFGVVSKPDIAGPITKRVKASLAHAMSGRRRAVIVRSAAVRRR